MLVTDVGQTILQGRQLAKGDLSADDWLQAVVAMLFHDIGYLRTLLDGDTSETSIINDSGETVMPPPGSTETEDLYGRRSGSSMAATLVAGTVPAPSCTLEQPLISSSASSALPVDRRNDDTGVYLRE